MASIAGGSEWPAGFRPGQFHQHRLATRRKHLGQQLYRATTTLPQIGAEYLLDHLGKILPAPERFTSSRYRLPFKRPAANRAVEPAVRAYQ